MLKYVWHEGRYLVVDEKIILVLFLTIHYYKHAIIYINIMDISVYILMLVKQFTHTCVVPTTKLVTAIVVGKKIVHLMRIILITCTRT